MTDIETGKKLLKESVVDECGTMPPTPQTQGNPVTVSVNFNASGAENVMELLSLLKNSGLQAAEGPSMPSQGMRMDMENFRSIVDAGNRDSNDMDVKFDIDDKKGITGISKAESSAWDNSPNELYADHQTMTHDLSGGINRQKRMFKPAAKGDNPMVVKHESVDKDSLKSRLLQALEEKKSAKKPDADSDGVPDWADKKPGKDDNADKSNKTKEDKVPPQFAKKKVDEVSKSTLKSYAKKASSSDYPSSASNLASRAAFALGKSPDTDFTAGEKDDRKSATRSKYIGKAIDKISKESAVESSVSENRRFRLVQKTENGTRTVKIYKDTDWNEYVVKHYENGQYLKDADYFDSDKQAVIDTARHFLSQVKARESSVAERSTVAGAVLAKLRKK